MAANIYECFIGSFVRGYHAYENYMDPILGEVVRIGVLYETRIKSMSFV